MHWPGAGPMLVIGLSTEALIFLVSAFEPQHLPLDWTLAYPELAGMDDEDGHGHGKKGSAVEQLDNMLEEAKIGPELIESLGQGLRSLSTNANKLSEISDASVKVTALAGTYEEASQALTGLSNAAESGASTGDNLKKMASTLEALNSSYESQLQGSQQQAETMQAMYAGITALMTNLSDSVEDTKRYKDNIAELSTNLSALNNIYGNMLTAMKS